LESERLAAPDRELDSQKVDVVTTKGARASHLRPEKPRATYEQIAERAVSTHLRQPYQRHELVAWAVDLLLAADLSVRDYDRGVDLVYDLVYATATSRREVAARVLGSTT
jgi:hypothetical protein